MSGCCARVSTNLQYLWNVVGVEEASSTLSYSINGFNIVDVNIGFNTISCMPDEINKSLNFEHHVAT